MQRHPGHRFLNEQRHDHCACHVSPPAVKTQVAHHSGVLGSNPDRRPATVCRSSRGLNGTYDRDVFSDRAVSVIESAKKDEPFYFYLAFQARRAAARSAGVCARPRLGSHLAVLHGTERASGVRLCPRRRHPGAVRHGGPLPQCGKRHVQGTAAVGKRAARGMSWPSLLK